MLAPIALGLLVLLLAGLALLDNSVVVVWREGLRVATLVPAVFGLFLLIVLVATVVTAVVLVQTESAWQIAVLIPLVVIPIAMMVVALAGYTGYAALYGRRRPPAHTDAVVVLGAGLSGEDLTPLLAARVDRGIEVAASAVTADGRPPLLVLSGGKGSDEVISEAEAMRRYALAHGVPAERLVLEDTSTTTEENLRNTRAALAERGLTDPELTVVTSKFHTLRSGSLPGAWACARPSSAPPPRATTSRRPSCASSPPAWCTTAGPTCCAGWARPPRCGRCWAWRCTWAAGRPRWSTPSCAEPGARRAGQSRCAR